MLAACASKEGPGYLQYVIRSRSLLVSYRYVETFSLAKVRSASKCTQHTALTSVQT
jgi:hypothetical protein